MQRAASGGMTERGNPEHELRSRLNALEEELRSLAGHAGALTSAIGEFRHALRRNAESLERNPGHQAERQQRQLRANLDESLSVLSRTRARMACLEAECERLRQRLASPSQ